MGVPEGHFYRLVSHEFLNRSKVHSGHSKPRTECVPQIVPSEILDSGTLAGTMKGSLHIVDRFPFVFALQVGEYVIHVAGDVFHL